MVMFSWQNPQDIDSLKQLLENGNLFISSTDTVMGLLAMPTLLSVERIRALKKNKADKSYLLLIAPPAMQDLEQFVDVSTVTPLMQHFITRCWPGPLTIIFKAGITCPDFLVGSSGTVALRCPSHNGLQRVLVSVAGLLSTSANLSGATTPLSFADVDPVIRQQIEYAIIDDVSLPSGLASTIVDFSGTIATQKMIGPFGLIREGAYAPFLLQEIYESYKLPS